MSPFGLALRLLRMRRQVTQHELCSLLGIEDKGLISAWETGIRRVPDPQMIDRICEVLDADPCESSDLHEAAGISAPTVEIPRHAPPELYGIIHKLAHMANGLSRSQISHLDACISQLERKRRRPMS